MYISVKNLVRKMSNDGKKVKMIKTDPKTIELLEKIQGWHSTRGNKQSYQKIVINLVFNDAKRKGLIE